VKADVWLVLAVEHHKLFRELNDLNDCVVLLLSERRCPFTGTQKCVFKRIGLRLVASRIL
jgi:hypothetical protein